MSTAAPDDLAARAGRATAGAAPSNEERLPVLPTRAPVAPGESVQAELSALRAEGLHRRLPAVDGPQSVEVEVDGRRVISFCSNDYLGFAAHPALVRAATEAMAVEGLGAGASRLIAGNLRAHRALEAALATWKGTEAALLFGTGYQANVGLIAALAGRDDVIYSDELNHASIVDGARLSRAVLRIFPHRDLATLERMLRDDGQRFRRRVIVTEALFSMDGDAAPLPALVDVARACQALLVVDEAHAVGVLGDRGVGVDRDLGVDVRMGTLGKALGGFGAYVAGSAQLVDLLLNRARSFVFSTAPPVPVAAAARAALALLGSDEGQARRQRLFAVCERLHAGLVALGLRPAGQGASHIVPLVVGDSRRAMAVSAQLLERGLYVQGIRPPTVPRGSARLRVTLSASHRDEHVDALLGALADLRSFFPIGVSRRPPTR